jgi:uncharacterized membrane protein
MKENFIKMELIFLTFLVISISLTPNTDAFTDEWWNASWHYRMRIEINSTDYERIDTPIEMTINFTNELNNLGAYNSFDSNSVRVVEYDSLGNVLHEIPSQFDPRSDYNALSNAVGEVIWIMNGTTPIGTMRYYYIYFDTETKQQEDYPTNLTYSFDGEEIYVNNTKLEIKIDTNRAEVTSGIYYAKRRDSNVVIFDRPSTERTVEYIQYYNGTDYLGFDLRNNASFTSGPVRLIIEQVGDEIVWNNPAQKTEGYIIKRYTFYSDSEWVKIEHIFKNNATYTIYRSSNGVGVLNLDADRAFGMDAVQGSTTDPYSWYSAYSLLGMGLGVINTREDQTTNFYANYDLLSGKIGIQLDNTSISSDGNISEESVVYFNDQASHVPVQTMRDKLANPVNITPYSSEKYTFNIVADTDFDIYNRGELVTITGNVTQNTHNLSFSVNATIDKGTVNTGDDITIVLYDDGTHGDQLAGDGVYTANYTILDDDVVGVWNITVYAYDSSEYHINTSTALINVSNIYSLNLTVSNPMVLTEDVVYANLTVKNYRNDTNIESATISCQYDSSVVTNITELGNGEYTINFTAPSDPGNYTLTCNATKNNNTGTDFSAFQVEAHKTDIQVNVKPDVFYADNVSLYQNQTFEINVTLTNIGNGTAYYTNITFVLPSNWSINPAYESCGNISVSSTCIKYFNITIPVNTSPENFTITAYANWANPDSTLNSTYNTSTVNVLSNPIIDVLEEQIDETINEGETSSVNITIRSIGNDLLENINISCVSGIVCTEFNVNFSQSYLSNLSVGDEIVINTNITIPEGYQEGSYLGTVNVTSSNNGYDTLTLNITVPESYTWVLIPELCSLTILPEKNGTVCQVRVNTTGNQPLNFTITPNSSNYTSVNITSFSLNSQSSYVFSVLYNTSSASAGNYTAIYTIDSESGSTPGNPASRNLTITLSVVLGPLLTNLMVDQSEQTEPIDVKLKIVDLSNSTINFANATVTLPDGSKYNVSLINVTPNLPGETSYWSYNFSNTQQRGVYSVSFIVYDKQGGYSTLESTFKIYSKLNITFNTSWSTYYPGEIPSINYALTDGVGVPLMANVTIMVSTPDNLLLFNESYTTNENGTLDILPSFQIPSDASTGSYILTSTTIYFDNYVNISVNKTQTYVFNVTRRLYVELDTSLVTYPENILKFYILIYSDGKIETPDLTLTVYDPLDDVFLTSQGTDMDIINQTDSSIIYVSEHLLPSDVSLGTYLAVLDIQQGERHTMKLKVFRISSGGPYDVVISSIEPEVQQGDYLDFEITIENMGELPQDVYLDYWISDSSGKIYNSVSGEAVFVDANSSRSFQRQLFVYSSQPVGTYYLNVKMTYSSLQPSIQVNRTFNVIVPSAPTPTPSVGPAVSAPVTGVVVAKEEIYKINISALYPEIIEMERGGIRYLTIEIKNNGNAELKNIYVDISGIPIDWFKRIGKIKDLAPGETTVQIIKFEVPDNAEIKTYEVKIKVSTERVHDEKTLQIVIYETRKDLLSSMIKSVRESIKEAEIRAYQASLERNVTDVLKLMEETNYILNEAEEYLRLNNLVMCENKIQEAKNMIERANYELAKTPPKTVLLLPLGSVLVMVFFLLVITSILIFYPKGKASKRLEKLRKSITGEVVSKGVPGYDEMQETVLQRKSEIMDLLKTLEDQFKKGVISKETYLELKRKYSRELSEIKIKVCKACGAPNEHDAKYCIKCGEKL